MLIIDLLFSLVVSIRLVCESQPSQPSQPKPSEVQTKGDNGKRVNADPEPVKPAAPDDAPTPRAESRDASAELAPPQRGSQFSATSSMSSLGESSVVVKYTLVEGDQQPERVRKLSLGERTSSDVEEGHGGEATEEEEEESEDEKQDNLTAPRVSLFDGSWQWTRGVVGGGGWEELKDYCVGETEQCSLSYLHICA